jgi:hypothetical protein
MSYHPPLYWPRVLLLRLHPPPARHPRSRRCHRCLTAPSHRRLLSSPTSLTTNPYLNPNPNLSGDAPSSRATARSTTTSGRCSCSTPPLPLNPRAGWVENPIQHGDFFTRHHWCAIARSATTFGGRSCSTPPLPPNSRALKILFNMVVLRVGCAVRRRHYSVALTYRYIKL